MRRLFPILLLLLLCSCSPKVYERVVYKHDTTFVNKVVVDSVYKRDSVFIREKGDTVYIYKEKIRERYKLHRDTTYIAKHDTTFVEKEKLVEKPLTKWQQTRLDAFWELLIALVLALLWIFRKPILKLLKL